MRASLSRHDMELIMRGRDIIESGELRRVRETLGMSRPEMAALLGVSNPTVRSWELTLRAPRRPYLMRIGKVVGGMRRAIEEERASTA